MRNLESRQWVCNTVILNGQATLIIVTPKAGFNFFITAYILSISVTGASTFVSIGDAAGTTYFEAPASVITSHKSPNGFKGIQATSNGVHAQASIAGARATCTVEGYYEPINV